MREKAIEITSQWLEALGVAGHNLEIWTAIVMVASTIVTSIIVYLVLAHGVQRLITHFTRKTSVKWDDILLRPKFLKWVWLFLCALICYHGIPASLNGFPTADAISEMTLKILLLFFGMMIVIVIIKSAFLLIADHDNVEEIARQMKMAHDNGEEFIYKPSHSLKGLQQMLIILVIAATLIFLISMILGKNPIVVVTGLGACATVLMLVFKDSILGMVAGIQLTANDMLQPGDWITADRYDINGIVREVNLATVKIQNYDKTIITIPPYKLVSETFQNWRGMQDSGGRRVMRSFNIDMNTIRFATDEEMARWSKEEWWKGLDAGIRQVNLAVFRRYLEHFIMHYPTMIRGYLFMIRELQPGADGLPLQIYFFTSYTEWKEYERLQADVLDHVLAIVGEFGLRIYQHPSGHDITNCMGR